MPLAPYAALIAGCCTLAGGPPPPPSATEAHAFRGRWPARASAGRVRSQRQAPTSPYFRAAGLRVGYERSFGVPGKGGSSRRDGVRDAPARCLVIVMAHADTVPRRRGNDEYQGVGTIVALARAVGAGPAPGDLWLVATGSEERPYTGRPDHLGAAALVAPLHRQDRLARRPPRAGASTRSGADALRAALSGSPARARGDRGARILDAARTAPASDVRWLRDSEGRATPTTASSRWPARPAAEGLRRP